VVDKQFKSGQKVKCIDASACDLSQDEIYTVKSQDEYVRLLGWGDNGYGPYRFELVEPEPPKSGIVAGDMVTVPDGHGHSPFGKAYEVLSIDEYGYATLMSGAWKMKVPVTKCAKVPQLESYNVHCGGPYIARSEYNRQGELLKKTGEAMVKVENERDDAKTWFSMTVDEIAQVRASLNHVEGQRDALLKERDSLKMFNGKLKSELDTFHAEREMLRTLKQAVVSLEQQRDFARQDNKELRDQLHNLNCSLPALQESHRLAQQYKRELDELKVAHAALKKGLQTPPERPELKAPSPPAWLRKGWWYCMNSDGSWYAYEAKPSPGKFGWHGPLYTLILEKYRPPGVPVERWSEACWQVTE
jgi:hypothetical protein